MKVLNTLFCLSIFFSISILNAQLKDTFEKGTLLKQNNSKIEGYIKSSDLAKLSSEICFKPLESDKNCTIYTTSDLKSFQTTKGEIFDLVTVKMNQNKTEITLFANLILKGETKFYRSSYNAKTFYIIRKDNMNYVLQDDEFITKKGEFRKYNFKGILNFVTENNFTETIASTNFNEDDFVEILTKYNSQKGFESQDLRQNEKAINYFILNVGGGIKKDQKGYFAQALYRKYYPKINRSTSLNLGLNYFSYEHSGEFEVYNTTIVSVPLHIQQNLFNKNIRPFVFAGVSFYYNKANALYRTVFLRDYNVGLSFGGGIEIDLYKGLMIRGEYSYNPFAHPILFGLAYNFSK